MSFEEAAIIALNTIHQGFARPITYRQDGYSRSVAAILSHSFGDDPFGADSSVRRRGYEIPKATLDFKPRNGDLIDDADGTWRVINVLPYDEARAWHVMVEKAS